MKRVRLWAVQKDDRGNLQATDVPGVDNTETEQIFEDLLVQSPQLLMDNLTLVGRQLETAGGPLDLLGLDEDGRLVVFELKRGTLTREAVAQVLDYASDLTQMDLDRFAELLEDSSGKNGIRRIEHFQDWYAQNFPDRESALEESPKMVLVGLGIDDRALRIVNFLASSGIEISLLTFHAFMNDGSLFLARQVESIAPPSLPPRPPATKQENLKALRSSAAQLGVGQFIEEVAAFVEKRVPGYKWPSKSGYTFILTEYTDKGKPSSRVYLNVSLADKRGCLWIMFQERAVLVLGSRMDPFTNEHEADCSTSKYNQVVIEVSCESWQKVSVDLEPILAEMVAGWRSKMSRAEPEEADSES